MSTSQSNSLLAKDFCYTEVSSFFSLWSSWVLDQQNDSQWYVLRSTKPLNCIYALCWTICHFFFFFFDKWTICHLELIKAKNKLFSTCWWKLNPWNRNQDIFNFWYTKITLSDCTGLIDQLRILFFLVTIAFFFIKTIAVIYLWIKSNCTREIINARQSFNCTWSDVEDKVSVAKAIVALLQIFLTEENW